MALDMYASKVSKASAVAVAGSFHKKIAIVSTA